MKFDIDRMCDLAGIGRSSSHASGLLRESVDADTELAEQDEAEAEEGAELEAEEGAELEAEGEDDIIEIDEKELVQELRRMKRIMNEAKKKSKRISSKRKESLQEAQLKAIIDQEVKNVLRDLNLGGGWMFGDKKPTQSKQGHLHHGSFLKGIGFK